MIRRTGRRDISEGCFSEIYEDEDYRYSLRQVDGKRSVMACPFSPYKPYVTITDNEAAVMHFNDSYFTENEVEKYMAAMAGASGTIALMRKTFFEQK